MSNSDPITVIEKANAAQLRVLLEAERQRCAELAQVNADRSTELEMVKRAANELAAQNTELTNKVKALVSQLWRFRKIFRSDTYDAVSSVNSLREVAMIVDLHVDQMLAEHDATVFEAGAKAGFMISSEGFNGECPYEHLSDKWELDHRLDDECPQEAIEQAKKYHTVKVGEVTV